MLNPTVTKDDVVAAILALKALYSAIAATGDEGIISGRLYAHVSDRMSLTNYESAIDKLVDSGLIRSAGYRLTANALPLA